MTAEKFKSNEFSAGVNIYPNPTKNNFFFEFSGEQSGSAKLQIINTLGQTVFTSQVEVIDGFLKHEINLSEKDSKGIYIVRLLLGGGQHDSLVILY